MYLKTWWYPTSVTFSLDWRNLCFVNISLFFSGPSPISPTLFWSSVPRRGRAGWNQGRGLARKLLETLVFLLYTVFSMDTHLRAEAGSNYRLAQKVRIFPSDLQVQLTESLGVQSLPLSSGIQKRYCLLSWVGHCCPMCQVERCQRKSITCYSVLTTEKLQDRGTASGTVWLSSSIWILHVAWMEMLNHRRKTRGEISVSGEKMRYKGKKRKMPEEVLHGVKS